jgi:N-acetylneuraminic acid mutarotase
MRYKTLIKPKNHYKTIIMKTIINTLRVVILITCIIMLSAGAEFAAKGKPQPSNNLQRFGAVGFSIGSKGYIGTGVISSYIDTIFKWTKDFWEYDPTTNAWTQKADFGGTAREFAVGFSIGNIGYVGTGKDGTWSKDFWAYDPSRNRWSQKADFGGTGRANATGFSIGSKGYIGTGYTYSGTTLINLNDFWEYDPNINIQRGGTWTRKTDFPGTPRYAAVSFSLGQKGYLGTGINYVSSNKTYTWFSDFYQYDPNAGTGGSWTKKADLADFGGLARGFAVGFSINNTKGYIGTGNTASYYTNEFWEYDPAENTWLRKADFGGTKRVDAVGFSIGIKGYIGTGLIDYSSHLLAKDFWEYNPSSDTWTQKADLGGKGLLKDYSAVGETEVPARDALIVYPNPSNSTFTFRLQTMNEELLTIQIFDMIGRLVKEYKSLPPNDMMTVGKDLNAGIYIAVVTQGEVRNTVRITKVN